MAVFDTVRCFYPLSFKRARQWEFQTHDTPSPAMRRYIIRADGALWRDESEIVWKSPSAGALHGRFVTVHPRWSPYAFSGPMELAANLGDGFWLTLQALFDQGRLQAIDLPEEATLKLNTEQWAWVRDMCESSEGKERNEKFKEAQRLHAAMVEAQQAEQRAFSTHVERVAEALVSNGLDAGWGDVEEVRSLLHAAASSIVLEWDASRDNQALAQWLRSELTRWWGDEAVESLGSLQQSVRQIRRALQPDKETSTATEAQFEDPPKRHWNYRVVKRIEAGEAVLEIREVHYEGGAICAWTESASRPMGESLDELRSDLMRMLEAMQKPVLEERDIEQKSVLIEATDR